MPDLTKKKARQALKPRSEPYWMSLGKGRALGFRRGSDTWIARYTDRSNKKHYEALKAATEYDEAKREAERWLRQISGAPARKVKRGTVQQALEVYLDHLTDQGREATAKRIRTKFKQVVWDDPLAEIQLSKLTEDDVSEWRQRLRDGRQPRSVNRLVRDLQAGLNRAVKKGYPGNAAAWRLDPLSDDIDGGGEIETAIMLTPGQRKALINTAGTEAALLFRGLELTGARPGELAAATAGDFDGKVGTLRLRHRKGKPPRLRPRDVVLSREGIAFLKQQVKRKLPAAPLFIGPERKPWDRHEWARAFRAARDAVNKTARGKARIPVEASAYGFRHARISELLQVHGVDPLTVALQTGTSLKMIEKSYFKFIAPALREKLAAIDEA